MIEQRIINGSLTELYVNGGGWLTQSFPTNFHSFHHKKILSAGESPSLWKEVSDAEKVVLEKADAEWVRPPQLLIDRWDARCVIKYNINDSYGVRHGQFNPRTGFFELNGITNITNEEAIRIDNIGNKTHLGGYRDIAYINERTLFPVVSDGLGFGSGFGFVSGIEVVRILDYYNRAHQLSLLDDFSNANYATNLSSADEFIWNYTDGNNVTKKICGKVRISKGIKFSMSALEEAHFCNLEVSLSQLFSKNVVFRIDCWQYLIKWATNTSPISVTVHPNVYAKLTGEGDYSDGNGTKEQWQQLMADAIGRQIAFATA